MRLKPLTLVICLICSLYAAGNVKTAPNISIKTMSDTLPEGLSIPGKLKLLLKVAGLPYENHFEKLSETELISTMKSYPYNDQIPPRYLDSLEISICDFVFHHNSADTSDLLKGNKIEKLSMNQKAALTETLIGWPGWVDVNQEKKWISFDFTAFKGEYGRRKMKRLSNYYALLANEWLLRNEPKKDWLITVHFKRRIKDRLDFFSNRLYSYCADNDFESYNGKPDSFSIFTLGN